MYKVGDRVYLKPCSRSDGYGFGYKFPNYVIVTKVEDGGYNIRDPFGDMPDYPYFSIIDSWIDHNSFISFVRDAVLTADTECV